MSTRQASHVRDRLTVDFLSAFRSLTAGPAIAVAVIVTTALAVGINLAMLGLIDRALLSPPPHVVHPDRVFTVAFETTGPSGDKGLVATTSFLAFEAIRTAVPDVTSAARTSSGTSITVENNQRLVVKATAATSGYFGMLGARAHKGRTLLPDDEQPPGGAAVAVVSHSLWQRAFGADEHVLGRRLKLGGLELDVIGVMPPGFSGHSAERTDLWLPLRVAMRDRPGWETAATLVFAEIGIRLAADQTVSRATSQLGAATGTRVTLVPIIGANVAPAPHQIAWWLAAVSLAVLLAGLANGATLSLVRGARRRRETCIRMSLGATRGRLARQLLIESTIVALSATGVALVLGYWLDEAIRRVLFPSVIESIGMTRRVVGAAAIGGTSTLFVAVSAGISPHVGSEDGQATSRTPCVGAVPRGRRDRSGSAAANRWTSSSKTHHALLRAIRSEAFSSAEHDVATCLWSPAPAGIRRRSGHRRRAVADGRDNLPFLEVRRFVALQGPGLAHWLMGTKLLLIGALALATAAVGIHAAFAHSVGRRTREIAVRLAVGASAHDVLLMVLREGVAVAARGLVSGVAVAILAGWAARSLIADLTSPGPLVNALTGVVVLTVAMRATWFPARAASRAQPNALLRTE
jgi:hypothetical protein